MKVRALCVRNAARDGGGGNHLLPSAIMCILPWLPSMVLLVMGLTVSQGQSWLKLEVHDATLQDHIIPFALAFVLQAILLVCGGPKRLRDTPLRRIVLTVLPFCVLTALSLPFGMRHFGGYDLSMLVDAGWRARLGQVPMVDYVFVFPPAFSAAAELAFRVSGDAFAGMVVIGCVHSVLAAAIIVWCLHRSEMSDPTTMSLAVCGVLGPFWLTTHLWHSLQASQAAAACLATGFMVWKNQRSVVAHLSVAVTAGWALVCKPNVGPVAAVATLALLVAAHEARRFLPLTFAAAVSVSLAICRVCRVDPALLMETYLDIGWSRADVNMFLSDDLPMCIRSPTIAGYLLPLLYLLVSWLPSVRRVASPISRDGALFGIAGVLVAAIGFRSNWDVKQNDWPLYFLAIALLAPPVARAAHHAPEKWLLRLTSSLAVVGFACWSCFSLGSSRLRNDLVGRGAFFELATVSPVDWGALRGLRSGARLHRVLMHTRHLLEGLPPGSPVFFGPRMEFLYAQHRRPSPLHLPVWWHPAASYRLQDSPAITDAFGAASFRVAVFLKNDFTGMPQEIVAYLNTFYVRDDSDSDLTIFFAQDAAQSARFFRPGTGTGGRTRRVSISRSEAFRKVGAFLRGRPRNK